jgi:general stress protein YciG
MKRSRRTNAVGMSTRDLASHAAKLCEQAARHPEIAHVLWTEAMACDAEIARLMVPWRGFASLPKARQLALASRGRKAAFEQGKSTLYTSETGKLAGRKSVEKSPRTKERMSEIGKIGGRSQRPEHIHTLAKRAWERRRAASAASKAVGSGTT